MTPMETASSNLENSSVSALYPLAAALARSSAGWVYRHGALRRLLGQVTFSPPPIHPPACSAALLYRFGFGPEWFDANPELKEQTGMWLQVLPCTAASSDLELDLPLFFVQSCWPVTYTTEPPNRAAKVPCLIRYPVPPAAG